MMGSWRNNRTGGFTMLELMVVCIIVAILLSMAAAQYRAFSDNQALTGFFNALVSKARLAKALSVSLPTPTNIKLCFDFDNDRVWIQDDTGTVCNQNLAYDAILAPSSTRVELTGFHGSTPPNAYTSGIHGIQFNARGTSDGEFGNMQSMVNIPVFVGLKADAAFFASGATNSGKFRSLYVIGIEGRAGKYNVGCAYSTAWNASWAWPVCRWLDE
jgi:prepilin-type N-terminal cleavage/methylation domain-containing protein